MQFSQLALNLKLNDDASLDNFYSGKNQQVISSLQQLINKQGERCIYLWGKSGSGRSHLLQACFNAVIANNSAVYLSFAENHNFSLQILDNLEQQSLVCFDDLEYIIGQSDWEEGLFHCFNNIAAINGRLLIAANLAPKALNFTLPDLQSRFAQGVVFQLQSLDDEEKLAALSQRAQARGLYLAQDVGKFLLTRSKRNMHSLFSDLDKLDKASLAAQRKLTIPFIKSVLFAEGEQYV